MKGLTDFLRLHPVFTKRGIRAAWYFYLAVAVVQFFTYAGFSFSLEMPSFGHNAKYYFVSVVPLLNTVAELIMVRIFLEVALRFLFPRSRS